MGLASALAAGTTVLSPVALLANTPPAAAEAGCDDGENSGALKIIADDTTWYNNNDAWRYYTELRPEGTSADHSRLAAHKDNGATIWFSGEFYSYTGVWDSGHFDELSNYTRTTNATGATRTYYYKRSCMK